MGTLRKIISSQIYKHASSDQYSDEHVTLRLLNKLNGDKSGKVAPTQFPVKKYRGRMGKNGGASLPSALLTSIADRSKDNLTLAQAGLTDNCRVKVSLLNPTSDFDDVFSNSVNSRINGVTVGEK